MVLRTANDLFNLLPLALIRTRQWALIPCVMILHHSSVGQGSPDPLVWDLLAPLHYGLSWRSRHWFTSFFSEPCSDFIPKRLWPFWSCSTTQHNCIPSLIKWTIKASIFNPISIFSRPSSSHFLFSLFFPSWYAIHAIIVMVINTLKSTFFYFSCFFLAMVIHLRQLIHYPRCRELLSWGLEAMYWWLTCSVLVLIW